MDAFYKTKTLVVLQKNDEYNKNIKEAFKEYWTITKFDFISDKEFNQYISNPDYSFCLSMKPWIDKSAFADAHMYGPLNKIGIIVGGKSSFLKYSIADVLISGLIDNGSEYRDGYYGFERTFFGANYRLKHIIKSMHTYLYARYKGAFKFGFGPPIRKQVLNYYRKNTYMIKDKTLLINKKYIKKEFDIASVFPYKYKVVEQGEIERAIQNNKKEYCYLVLVVNYQIFFVFDTGSGDILFAPNKLISFDKLSKALLKAITKSIKS